MKWNQLTALLLVLTMLLCLGACSSGTEGESGEQQNTEQDPPAPPATSEQSGSETTKEPSGGDTSGGETKEPAGSDEPSGGEPTPPAVSAPPLLSLQKQRQSLEDWDGERLLVSSKASCVTLWPDDAAAYPALAELLGQRSGMVLRSSEEEYDNLSVMVREDLSWPGMGEETWVSTFDDQVRRADGVVLSLLNDSYADHGMVQDFRGMHGSNYDVVTGQELALTDVVEINNDLALAVAAELNRHQWAGDVDYTEAVELYFANTPYDGFAWTLDYNGLTFYFGDGDLEEPGNGRKSATVSFAEHPELFQEKFLTAPAAYLVELPLDHSFFTDLDGDGALEELQLTALFDSEMGTYTQLGLYTETTGRFVYEDCSAAGFLPYYAKTADGGHWLYLFQEQYEGGPVPTYLLKVYDLSGGKIEAVGQKNAGPGYVPVDCFRVPTDPQALYLEDYDAMAQDMMPFAIGPDGLPAPKQ